MCIRDRSHVSTSLKKLENKGLVEKIQSKDNKKHIEIILLDKAEPVSYTHLDVYKRQLVYRLDKIQKNTNLDLRNFEDAIAFKIALMVVKYMKHMDTMD